MNHVDPQEIIRNLLQKAQAIDEIMAEVRNDEPTFKRSQDYFDAYQGQLKTTFGPDGKIRDTKGFMAILTAHHLMLEQLTGAVMQSRMAAEAKAMTNHIIQQPPEPPTPKIII